MNKYSNKYILDTGVGLQEVDKLKPSRYFINESEKYIKGEITLEELDNIINEYYEDKVDHDKNEEEADKVAIRISKLIKEDSFTFTVGQLLSIHKCLFEDILDKAGELRNYNFSKKEWVLDGASVIYGDYREIKNILDFDFNQEKNFNYKELSIDEKINHLGLFVSNLWQIHPFVEGNTRTTAVFLIKYLRSLGFDITNDTFAKNSWYFRNALVRANYTNFLKDIYEDRSFITKFLRNLLLKENNKLLNRELHISNNKSNSKEINEIRLLTLIKNNPKIKITSLAKELNVSPRTIKNVINALKKDNKIKRIKGKRYGEWKI